MDDDRYAAANGHAVAGANANGFAHHDGSDGDFLPSEQMPLRQLAACVRDKVEGFLAREAETEQVRHVQEQTRVSLGVVREAFDRYGLPAISLSYNGGKDCLVLLILYIAALASHPSFSNDTATSSAFTDSIQSVYIVSKHPFPEVESFVQSTSKTYSLSLTRYAKSMKAAFEDYLQDFRAVRAIFVGTRRTDPHGGSLTHFDETDHGWPRFMRIHPVIDWQYVDIWTFICELKIPYCTLYDQGYTSLGGTTDTHPNPALRRPSLGGSGEELFIFRPAYELVEDGEERLGRDTGWKAIADGTSLMHRLEGSKHEKPDAGQPHSS